VNYPYIYLIKLASNSLNLEFNGSNGFSIVDLIELIIL